MDEKSKALKDAWKEYHEAKEYFNLPDMQDRLVQGYIEILEEIKFLVFDDADTIEEFFKENYILVQVVEMCMETLEDALGKKRFEKTIKEHPYFRYTNALQWGNKIMRYNEKYLREA